MRWASALSSQAWHDRNDTQFHATAVQLDFPYAFVRGDLQCNSGTVCLDILITEAALHLRDEIGREGVGVLERAWLIWYYNPDN